MAIIVTVTNTTTKDRNVVPGPYARTLKFIVRDSSGKDLPSLSPWLLEASGGGTDFRPSVSTSVRLDLMKWVRIRKPGTYAVPATLRAADLDNHAYLCLKSNTITVAVMP